MVRYFTPTEARVKRSMRDIVSGNTGNQGSEQEAPDSKTLKGIREAKLKKIDLNKVATNGWHVILPDGTQAKVKSSSDLGLEYLPDGDVKEGFLYPKEDTFVKVEIDANGKINHIVATSMTDLSTSTPVGATRIVRGDSEVIVGQSETKINTKNATFIIGEDKVEINAKEVYINGKKIE